jgi:hypothetical protein
VDLPYDLAARRVGVALVFAPAEGAFPLDPTRARADLDLRLLDAAGATVAASQSFDDDQEVASGERVRAVRVERANGAPFHEALLAVFAAP